jgi:putative endonuclease
MKTKEPQLHFVYIVRCADGSLYTGYSTDVEKRVATHNAGQGAKYTQVRLPVALCASWSFQSKSEALRAERAIKGLSRGRKLRLIEQAAEADGTSARLTLGHVSSTVAALLVLPRPWHASLVGAISGRSSLFRDGQGDKVRARLLQAVRACRQARSARQPVPHSSTSQNVVRNGETGKSKRRLRTLSVNFDTGSNKNGRMRRNHEVLILQTKKNILRRQKTLSHIVRQQFEHEVEFLRRLVRAKSENSYTAENSPANAAIEAEVAAIIVEKMQQLGWHPELHGVSSERQNVLCVLPGTDPARRTLILTIHMCFQRERMSSPSQPCFKEARGSIWSQSNVKLTETFGFCPISKLKR